MSQDSGPPPTLPLSGGGKLDSLIKARIRDEGPISVADYMELALAHPQFGYYMRRDPLGVAGDFITAPEISQLFGELIGLWLARQWEVMGKPKAALIELGPGRGTLMADALRATKKIAGFHDAISVHLMEMSPALKTKQWQVLAGKHPNIEWHTSIDDLPEKPWLLVANEFFDALPIRQFVFQGEWKERMVGMEGDILAFSCHPCESRDPVFLKLDSRFRGNDNSIYETCPAALAIIRTIAAHIKEHSGAAIIVDYGYAQGKGDTLQAVRAHACHDPLVEPGTADLTAHVDFAALKEAAADAAVYGPVPQGAFLERIGARVRAATLYKNATSEQRPAIASGLERLISPDQMGDLFKAMAILPPNHPRPEGF